MAALKKGLALEPLDRNFTPEEAEKLFLISRIAKPELSSAEHRLVETQKHPDGTYSPKQRKCLFNAIRAKAIVNGELAAGYSIYADFVNGRFGRVELTAHLWNVLPDGTWLDTTPAEGGKGVTSALLVKDDTGAVMKKFGMYLANAWKTATGKDPQLLGPPEKLLDDARCVELGMVISNDGNFGFLRAVLNPKLEQRVIDFLQREKVMLNSLVYAGPATAFTWMRERDAMLSGMAQTSLESIDALADRRCCWHCYAVGAKSECGRCHKAIYCSRECQLADWKAGHKAECKTL